jgi:hypothetical protein
MDEYNFSHVLQKKGLLKNFSIAKIVPLKQIEDLKNLIKSRTSSEDEFKRIFGQEMMKIADMHNSSNPIPGIIYTKNGKTRPILELAKFHVKQLKSQNFTKSELCFCIMAIISGLGLTKDDFRHVDPREFGQKNINLNDDDEEDNDFDL